MAACTFCAKFLPKTATDARKSMWREWFLVIFDFAREGSYGKSGDHHESIRPDFFSILQLAQRATRARERVRRCFSVIFRDTYVHPPYILIPLFFPLRQSNMTHDVYGSTWKCDELKLYFSFLLLPLFPFQGSLLPYSPFFLFSLPSSAVCDVILSYSLS